MGCIYVVVVRSVLSNVSLISLNFNTTHITIHTLNTAVVIVPLSHISFLCVCVCVCSKKEATCLCVISSFKPADVT